MTEWDLLPEPPHLSQEWENFSEEWAQIAKSQKEPSSSFGEVPILYKAEYCIEGFCESFMFEINKADAAEPIKDKVNKARVEIINPATTYKMPEFKMLKHRLHEVHYKVIEENVKLIIKQLKPPTILLGRYRCYNLQPGNIIDGDNVTYSEFCQMDHWKIKGYPTLWIRGTWLLTK
jgi:hypothetical protein